MHSDFTHTQLLTTSLSKYKITSRELEIINLILKGKTNKEIAEELFLSVQTVKNTIYKIFKKTSAKNRGQLIHFITNFQSMEMTHSKLTDITREISMPDKIIPSRNPGKPNKITLFFRLKKLLTPLLAIIALLFVTLVICKQLPQKELDSLIYSSIAILPFDDLTPQRDQKYLCDGFADEIIYRLTKINNLKIPARTSSSLLKNNQLDIKEIGKILNVETVLKGSLRKEGNKLRIIVQLISAKNNMHIWSAKYERHIQDIFSIQDEISVAIVENLKIKLFEKEIEHLTENPTKNVEAYNLYLKGQWFINKRTELDLYKAIQHFENAIDIDPDFAMAYNGLANSYVILPDYSSKIIPREAYKRSKEAITRALEININLAEAHATFALILCNNEYHWDSAEREFRHAIELKPSLPSAHHWYALFLMSQARFNEALKRITIANDLDPLSLVINRNKGVILFYARRYEEAISEFKKTLELDSRFVRTHYFLGRAYLHKSMPKEALAEFNKEKENLGYWDFALEAQIGITYAKMGRRNEARVILNTFIEKSKYMKTGYNCLAILCFALGENDQGFNFLEEAYRYRSTFLRYLKVDPRYDSVRSDPRFRKLIRKMGLSNLSQDESSNT